MVLMVLKEDGLELDKRTKMDDAMMVTIHYTHTCIGLLCRVLSMDFNYKCERGLLIYLWPSLTQFHVTFPHSLVPFSFFQLHFCIFVFL